MLKTLSGRFLVLTVIFVMIAEVLIFAPSVARFRQDYLAARLDRAQIASLALLAEDMITTELEAELLENAGVFNVVLRRDETRQLVLSSPIPEPVAGSYDLRTPGALMLIADAMRRLVTVDNEVIRVIGAPTRDAGLLIEVTMPTQGLRAAMLDYGLRVLILSAVISAITAALLYLSVRSLLVKPIRAVVGNMKDYAQNPEDARNLIAPASPVQELRQAEEALASLQTQLTGALKQKERLAQLGEAVAKVSHDLRNILTTAQLFTDRIEMSEDPTVRRLAPKLVNSITRAVNLCESTLAFGRAEEPAPRLTRFPLFDLVEEVVDGERLASNDTVSFAEDVPSELVIRADREQLYRVLSNLTRNARQAIEATHKPGEIAVTGTETETDWIITVMDTGPGLPSRAQDHLFKAFQSTARKGGSGLGLAIASELIRGHGGIVSLRATGTAGTCFEITLPKQRDLYI